MGIETSISNTRSVMLHHSTITSTLTHSVPILLGFEQSFPVFFFSNDDLLLNSRILKNPLEDLDHISMSFIIIRQLFKRSVLRIELPLRSQNLSAKGSSKIQGSKFTYFASEETETQRQRLLVIKLESSSSQNQTQVCFLVPYSQSKHKCILLGEGTAFFGTKQSCYVFL